MNLLSVFLILFQNLVEIYCSFQIGNPDGHQVIFDRLDGTCRGHHVPIIFNYNGVRTDGDKLLINSTIVSKEDIDAEPTLSIRIQRCKNRENLDTCEEFHAYRTEYCSLLESDSAVWRHFFAGFTPKWKCPIKKGRYRGLNNMMDMSTFLLFPIDNWVWKITAETLEKDSDRLLSCIFAEAHGVAKQ